jgi:hypothetical protein
VPVTAKLADRLHSARRRGFVGRTHELAVFRALLDATGDGNAGAVVFVCGSGGVGKTSLLHQFAWLAERAGREVTWSDGQDPAAGGDGTLLLVDDADALCAAERPPPDDLLARVGADTIVVFAARTGPPLAWRVDPGWCELLHTLRLDNLDDADSRTLLAARRVPAAEHATVLAFTRGHPLALALVADVRAQHGAAVPPSGTPQIVTALLGRLIDSVPGPAHRAALEACSQVAALSEPLLAALVEGYGEGYAEADPHELFDWLRGLAVVECGPRGLVLHDLARDVLGGELRWRDPARHAALHRAAGGYYQRQFAAADPATQRAVLRDFLFLHRDSPIFGPFLRAAYGPGPGLPDPDGDHAGAPRLVPMQPHHLPVLRDLVRRFEGERSAGIAAYWFDRQPGAVAVAIGGNGAVAGFALVLGLDETTERDRAADPGAAAAWEYLARHAPLRAGEKATMLRFWIDAVSYQQPGPVQMLYFLDAVRRYLTSPALAYSLLYHADPEVWSAACAYGDFPRLPDADFTVEGGQFAAFGHDWRRLPPLGWLALLAERETAAAPLAVPVPEPVPDPPPQAAALGAEEFAAALRAALRDLARVDRLGTSALLNTALVRGRTGPDAGTGERARALQQLIREAAAALADSPRDRRAVRALHHTHIQPAGTQERAAELLGLPMSTFRRHLAAGLIRLTEVLWQQELDAR